VFTTKLVKFATPLLTLTVVVPEVKLDCGLPDLMDMMTEPLAVVTTLPKLSSTCTATLGIELPGVPGPGVAGLKASWVAAPAVMVTVVVPQVLEPFVAVMVGVAAVSSP